MAKIIGNTTATPNPRPDWAQTDEKKADYIKNKPTIPTKTSELTNDSGFKTTDNNTTYSLSKSGTEITLTGSDGSTTSVAASDVDTINSAVSSHNTETSAHNDIRDLIAGLTTRLNTLADSDDTTLDQMSEVVAYIKSNKELIEAVTTDKVNVSDIINNLTTNVANKPLSAAQGVAIKALIDALQTEVNSKASSNHHHDGDYADINHNHDDVYAFKEHTHDEYGATYVHPDTHPASMITGLATVATSGKYDDLTGKPDTFTPEEHTHDLSEVSDTSTYVKMTATERNKLSGIAAGAQVNTVTGVKGNSESTYRTGNINITKANIGLDNVDNTADSAKSVKHATSADSATTATTATSATKATQDGSGNVIADTYETKTDAQTKLDEAKEYADTKEVFYVNATINDDGSATIDKTYNEIVEAKNSNRAVYAVVVNDDIPVILPLVACLEEYGVAMFNIMVDNSEAIRLIVYSDGTVDFFTAHLSNLTINGINYNGSSDIDFTGTINSMITTQTDATLASSKAYTNSAISNIDLSAYETTTDAEAKLTEAKEYTDSVSSSVANTVKNDLETEINTKIDEVNAAIATKSDANHNHDSDYDVKGSANTALASAKEYTEQCTDQLAEGFAYAMIEMYGDDYDENADTFPTIREVANDESGVALTNAKSYTDTKVADLINSAPTTLDTLGEIATAMEENADVVEALETAIGTKANASDLTSHTGNKSNPHGVTKSQVGLGSVVNTGDSATPVSGGTTKFTTGGAYTELNKKVDKVDGKGLSTNDYTTTEKNKLAGIAEGANKTTVDTALSSTSTNPVQNKAVTSALAQKADKSNGIFYIEGNSTTAGTWTGTCEDITEYYDGLTIAYRTNIAGISGGTTLNINRLGAIAVRRNTSAVTTNYGVNSLLHLTYTTIEGVGYWQTADYDSNTKTTTGTTNKVDKQLFLVGATSQASSATTYSNKNVYIGADNCLYSNGEKVAIENSTISKVSVKKYGAKGDGSTDDTAAFQTALTENRLVYVPEGTYILSNTLLITENSELELEQSTILKFTQTNANCIAMQRLARLTGNRATIIVPYTFAANVIHASTDVDEAGTEVVPPFTKWDPQWKMSRYVTDINICKPDDRGFHYSKDGDCYGAAIYINCDSADPSTFMWGVDMKGLRIAGGFTYGIRIHNEGSAWNHDMRIEAVIDACETGVSVENCNMAHLAVTIQPRQAYSDAEVYKPYAKYGIKLVNSLGVDLSSSYVWDWTSSNTLLSGNAPGCEYQHIAMYGDCSGVNIYDASTSNSNYFWQRIYYDNLASMLNATIHGAKGKIPIDPKYAFYKNYRQGGYDFMNQNLTWRDYHNMVRYDVPVVPQNGYLYPNRLYKIGYFTINGACENPIADEGQSDGVFGDELGSETITIEENNRYGLTGWSNLYYQSSAIVHYWSPLPSVYESRVPIYFYSKSGNTYTIYRFVPDDFDLQHIYNCRISITNARRFIFDFADMGAIGDLDTSTYIRITPQIQGGTPKLAGQYSLVDGKPVICTTSAAWSTQGAISTAATTKQLALEEDVDSKLNSLSIKAEQTDFVIPASGEYVTYPTFTDIKAPYQENVWCNSGTMASVNNSIWIEPRKLSVGDVVRIRGIDFTSNWPGKARIDIFDSTGAYVTVFNMAATISSYGASGSIITYSTNTFGTYEWDSSTATLTIVVNGNSAGTYCSSYTFSFGGGYATGYNASSVIMTINEDIAYEEVWEGEPRRLDESLYAQSVLLTSPNGSTFKLSVSDSGTLSVEPFSG